ncbi:MAG: NUDIX hydrolase [Bacteroidetes bacterium]|nr:NUDIX hydrolase [Fibrella sp.]
MKVRPCVVLSRSAENSSETEILLLHYRYGNEDVYALPGGNPDKGENLPETIRRELQEELGLTVQVGPMLFCGEVILPEVKNDVLHTVFEGQIAAGTPTLNPAETTALRVVWKPLHELEGLNLYPNIGAELCHWFMVDGAGPGYIGPIRQRYF